MYTRHPTLAGIAALVAAGAFGQADLGTKPKVPAPILDLSNRALASPSPFAADLLIRLAGLPQVPVETRQQWLEQAFDFAATSPTQEADLRRALTQLLIARGAAEARLGLHAEGENVAEFVFRSPAPSLSPMDGFHLRTRSVEEMLQWNPERAQDLFRQITVPDFTSVPCDQSVTGDSSAYYRLATRVFLLGFNPKERSEHRDVDFLVNVTLAARSANDLAPLTRFLPAIVDDLAFTRVTGAIVASLQQMRPPRASEQYELDMQILADQLKARGKSPFPLMVAYRGYLVGAIRNAKCDPVTFHGRSLPVSAENFNETVRAYGGEETAQIRPIELDEIERKESIPSVVLVQPLPERIGEFLLRSDALRASTEQQCKKPEWETAVRDLMNATDEWLGDRRESSKVAGLPTLMLLVSMYGELGAIAPEPNLRHTLLSRQIAALSGSNGSQVRDAEPRAWLASASRLLAPSHLAEEDRIWVRDALGAGGADPLLSLYRDYFLQFGK